MGQPPSKLCIIGTCIMVTEFNQNCQPAENRGLHKLSHIDEDVAGVSVIKITAALYKFDKVDK